MNYFLKGDFKIDESWDKKNVVRSSRSREKERSRQRQSNKSLVNAGKNIISASIPDILDDQVGRYVLREFEAEIPPPPQSVKSEKKISSKDGNIMLPPRQQKASLPGSENDLITSMATRLKNVEVTNKNLKEELRQKNATIQKLKAEGNFVKGFREDAGKAFARLESLQGENKDLRQKVQEMQKYLLKYGLKWVGGKIEGKLESDKLKQAIKKGNYQYRLPSQIDIGTLMRRIEQLNGGLHSEGMGTEIYQENGVHKFRKAEPLPIGFFANGIAIKGYKFYSYQTKQSLQILSDLIDGYFPSVLKARYPNGVFMKVTDKLAEKYGESQSEDIISTFESKANNEFKAPSKEQFLMKLPKNIVKNGKVISIRGQIEKRLNGENPIKQQEVEQQNDAFEKIEGVTVFKTEEHNKLGRNQVGEEDLCTLKIRNESGDIFILHLGKQRKMQDVYKWMKKVTNKSFKVMGNFPRRSYEEGEEEDLQALGFCPNAMLHIQCGGSN